MEPRDEVAIREREGPFQRYYLDDTIQELALRNGLINILLKI
jgi:hypothetical protein